MRIVVAVGPAMDGVEAARAVGAEGDLGGGDLGEAHRVRRRVAPSGDDPVSLQADLAGPQGETCLLAHGCPLVAPFTRPAKLAENRNILSLAWMLLRDGQREVPPRGLGRSAGWSTAGHQPLDRDGNGVAVGLSSRGGPLVVEVARSLLGHTPRQAEGLARRHDDPPDRPTSGRGGHQGGSPGSLSRYGNGRGPLRDFSLVPDSRRATQERSARVVTRGENG